jgi:hypothetical protein
MMTRGANNALPEVLLCRQMISVEIGGRSQQLHELYDSGATLTLITHEAADRTGLQPIQQQLKSVSGLNGVVVPSSCFYSIWCPWWTAMTRCRSSRHSEWRGSPGWTEERSRQIWTRGSLS